MGSKRELPVGISSFEELRLKKLPYVDKTKIIWYMANYGTPYMLARPKGFGKTMLVTTLKAYFEGKRELFDGLELQKMEDEEKNPWKKHPVFHLEITKEKFETEEDLRGIFKKALSEWEEIYGAEESEGDSISLRFGGLLRRAHEKTGNRAVILVDNYDKPLLKTAFTNPELCREYRKISEAFLIVIKSSGNHIHASLITGITKYRNLSIFSGLNSLNDVSTVSDYLGLCGFTKEEIENNFEEEIKSIADKYSYSYEEALERINKKYGGYDFDRAKSPLYSPFSTIKALSNQEFKNYLLEVTDPVMLETFAKKSFINLSELEGEFGLSDHSLGSYIVEDHDPLQMMLQSGCITIIGYEREFHLYYIGFTNEETKYPILDFVLPRYMGTSELKWENRDPNILYSESLIKGFLNDIEGGKIEEFMQKIKSIFVKIPHDDLPKDIFKLEEQDYKTLMYLILTLMKNFTQTEIYNSKGRTDFIIHTTDKVYIFEFKLSKEGTAEDSIKQIIEDNYAEKHRDSGKKIIAVGASFDEEAKTIKDWIEKEI